MKQNEITIIMIIILILLSFASLFIGAYDLQFSNISEFSYNDFVILLKSRLPRLIAILLTGIAMSIAGLIMQSLFRNKFVSPTTGATIASSQLGIVVAFIFVPSASLDLRIFFAYLFAIVGTLIYFLIIQQIKLKNNAIVPLIGIMFSGIISGLVSQLAYRFDLTQMLNNMLVGDFSLILAGRYEILYLVIPLLVIASLYANKFNIVALGENYAINLGLNYKRTTLIGLSICALLTASIVVIVGTISYLGLIIPNIVTMFQGDRIKNNLVNVGLFGALFLLICDIIARLIIAPFEMPVELIVGVLGSVIFGVMLYIKLTPNTKLNRRVN